VIAPRLALIVAFVCVPTAVVLIANVADVLPAETVTDAGIAADEVLLVKATFIPPEIAGPVSVTVPVDPAPPATVLGDALTDASIGSVIVKVAILLDPFKAAVIVAETSLFTADVVTVNEPRILPAAIEIDPGTLARVELLDSFTVNPPLGAGPVSVTVPAEETSPATVLGLSATDERLAGLTVSVAVSTVLPAVAEIEAICWVD
jgi:hypothetical protein